MADIKAALLREKSDPGFISVTPDLNCRDVPVELECAERAHLGLGHAMEYKYAVGAAKLMVVAEEASGGQKKFLRWVSERAGVEALLYVGGVFVTPRRRAI